MPEFFPFSLIDFTSKKRYNTPYVCKNKERMTAMSQYHISRIHPSSPRELRQMEALLEKEGIRRDQNLDYSAGLFDDDYELAATGSCFKNTLRCMAVDSAHQGEGLMNIIVSHLVDYEYQRGIMELFLYTKCSTARFFSDLGFYEIARVDDTLVFMENRKTGFSDYLKHLKAETEAAPAFQAASFRDRPLVSGAIVMNANPFTLGHQYLVETAASQCDLLHVFVVSEDVSLVPFSLRRELVLAGCAHLDNVICHDTGSYMISNATFPSYFLKDEETVIRSHARLDIQIFTKIASALHISMRFAGEEPFSQVTGIYNQLMKEHLEYEGIRCHIIPRKANKQGIISASLVRRMIQEGDMESLKKAVPESTYRFFTSPQASPVIQAIKEAEEVIHY